MARSEHHCFRELGADGKDKRIRKTGEFILARSQDKQSGGFAYVSGEDGGSHEKVVPCLTGTWFSVYSSVIWTTRL